MTLRWQFSDQDRGLISNWKSADGYYLLEEVDRFEGTWKATFIGDGFNRFVKSGQLQACLLACDLDACPPPGPPNPPRPKKRREWG